MTRPTPVPMVLGLVMVTTLPLDTVSQQLMDDSEAAPPTPTPRVQSRHPVVREDAGHPVVCHRAGQAAGLIRLQGQ